MILEWIFIGVILNYLGLLHGWTLFWFIFCILLDTYCLEMRNKK